MHKKGIPIQDMPNKGAKMLTETTQKIAKDTLGTIIKSINKMHGFELYNVESSSGKKHKLPFYKKLQLLEITDFASMPPLVMRFFIDEKLEILKLDGAKESLEEVNKIEKPILNEKNIVEYAKFALGSVMGEEGNFRLVETMEELEFSRDPTEKEQKLLAAAIKPARVTKSNDIYNLDACVLYSDCVYRAIISVSQGGKVEIEEEKSMLSDMPTRQIMLL